MNSFGWEVFWWVICRALRQVVTPISYWRSGCTFPYILFFRHFESWTPLMPEPSSFIAQCWKICRMRPQERKLIWEAVYDCLLFDLKIPQLLTADFSKILKHSVAFSGISPVYSLNLCVPHSHFWTYLVKEGGAVHGRLFGDWWWAAAKGFGDHSIIVGHSHSTLVHFHLLFQQSTLGEKENGFKKVAQRQWICQHQCFLLQKQMPSVKTRHPAELDKIKFSESWIWGIFFH